MKSSTFWTSLVVFITLSSIVNISPLIAQQLDVEGHSKIRGNLDINHMDDTTTVYIGRNAGINTDFSYQRSNTFVGSNAGYSNTNGGSNCFFGLNAGLHNTSGYYNNYVGQNAGISNTEGFYNCFFGLQAGYYISGSRNVAIGKDAGPPQASANVNDRLYINMERTSEPLIYGEFDNDLLTIHHKTANPGNNTGFRIKNTGLNKNWWNLYTVNATGNLFLYSKAGGTDEVGSFNDVSGEYSALSDRRSKKNIRSLGPVLSSVMMLQPVAYQYLGECEDEKEHIGLIAQKLNTVFPQFVYYNPGSDLHHVNYAGLSVVAIKAIQEMELKYVNQVGELKVQNEILKDQVDQLKKNLSEILNRLEILEKRKYQNM